MLLFIYLTCLRYFNTTFQVISIRSRDFPFYSREKFDPLVLQKALLRLAKCYSFENFISHSSMCSVFDLYKPSPTSGWFDIMFWPLCAVKAISIQEKLYLEWYMLLYSQAGMWTMAPIQSIVGANKGHPIVFCIAELWCSVS